MTLDLKYLYLTSFIRWLIDTDKDEEGMRVLVALHGGNPADLTALDEFREIKENVEREVHHT